MTNLREAVSTALCRTYFAHDYEGEELERLVHNERMDWLDEADAAISVVLRALKEPSEAMTEAGEDVITYPADDFIRNRANDVWQSMLTAFTRDHYLSALAEEDGKDL